MRHRIKSATLGRKQGPRQALLRTQAISLIINKKIKTTNAKAKVLKSFIEKLITKAKKGNIANQRNIYKVLNNKKATEELVKKIVPKLKDKQSGYTRITKLGVRKGDGAPVSQIEIITL